MIDRRLAICAGASVVAHFALARGLDQLPPRVDLAIRHQVEIRVVTPPPPEPPPEPPPPEPPAEPPKVVHEQPRTAKPAIRAEVPKEAPPAEHAPVATETTPTPVYGVTMESTSQGGSGPAVPVGNTTQPQPAGSAAPAKPLAPPVAAYEVTKMPIPQGRCTGKYTDAARAASLEGTVVLDLIVDEHGRARDIEVVSGLGSGLTEAAIAALAACRFSPGEKNGTPVPVRVRGFKIRFLLQDGE